MATESRESLKSKFVKGAKPLAAWFASWLDSFWHKSDKIPADSIDGLPDMSSYQTIENKNQPNGYAGLDDNAMMPNERIYQPDLQGYQQTQEKGVPLGYAELDGDGKIPLEQLPENMGNDTNIGNADIEQMDEIRIWNGKNGNIDITNFNLFRAFGDFMEFSAQTVCGFSSYQYVYLTSLDLLDLNFKNLGGHCDNPNIYNSVLYIGKDGNLKALSINDLKALLNEDN